MKVLAVLLLCAFVAVQGRSAVVQSTSGRSLATLGENPWVVHLRVAVSTSGLLNSGAGSLISSRWVLTASSTIENSRFIWIRYGVVNVINPSLVTEASLTRVSPASTIALININRDVLSTDNISPVGLSALEFPQSANVCFFGANDSDGPGESLSCADVSPVAQDDGSIIVSSDDFAPTEFDLGAALVADGVQVGVLVDADGSFVAVDDSVREWISTETGIDFSSAVANSEVDPLAVQFVN